MSRAYRTYQREVAKIDYFEGVLCHCDQAQDGHALGTPGCSSEVKKGTYTYDQCSLNHGSEPVHTRCHGWARGTCPECGKKFRVVRIEMREHAGGKVIYGAASLGMAPHKAGGQECPGSGRVPTETTFTTGHALTQWQAAQGWGAA